MYPCVPPDAANLFPTSAYSENIALEDAALLNTIITDISAFEKCPLWAMPPTPENVRSAVGILKNELLGQFGSTWRQDEPFDLETSTTDESNEDNCYAPEGFANALAMVIQPIARPFIVGPTPLYWVKNNGSTNFVEALSVLHHPRQAVRFPWNGIDSTLSGWIAEGLQHQSSFFWVEGKGNVLSSRVLEEALTATTWTGLSPFSTDLTTLPIDWLWVTTDTRVRSRELFRLSVEVNVDQIDDYSNYLWSALAANVAYNRPRFYGAALTLVRAWLEAGKPTFAGKRHWYSSWSQVIGGILQVAEVPGFLHNQE